MGILVDAYLNRSLSPLKRFGLFDIWIQHVRSKADAGLLANMFLEAMRSESNSKLRTACAVLSSLMGYMTYPEMAEVISNQVAVKDREVLKNPYASEFYLKVRACVLLQIEGYWNQFLEDQKGKTPSELPEVPFKKPEALLSTEQQQSIYDVMKKAMDDSAGETIKKIRRDIEGEGWKDGEALE